VAEMESYLTDAGFQGVEYLPGAAVRGIVIATKAVE
jgi:hypothetical protein